MRPVNAFDITFDILLFRYSWDKTLFYFEFYYIIVDRMSSDKVDLDRALGGDLWVVQETEQLQRTFIKWLDHWLMIMKMYRLKVQKK